MKKRPRILTWLCSGSAIIGLLWVIMLLAIFGYSLSGKTPPGLFPHIPLEYMNAGYWFMITEIILAAFGLTSVYMMWQLKRNGFYLYAGVKTIVYFLPVVFIGTDQLHFPGLIFTSIAIIMYGAILTNLPTNE
jgi:hypothetical protein